MPSGPGDSGPAGAAMTLADVLDRGGPGVQSFGASVCLLLASSIELRVKTLIIDSARLYEDPLPAWLNSTYSIAKLWKIAADYIAKSFPDDRSADPRIPHGSSPDSPAIDCISWLADNLPY